MGDEMREAAHNVPFEVETEEMYGGLVRCLYPDDTLNKCGCSVVRTYDVLTFSYSIAYHPEANHQTGDFGPPCQVFDLNEAAARALGKCVNGHTSLFESMYREHLKYWHSEQWEAHVQKMRADKSNMTIKQALEQYQIYIADQQRGKIATTGDSVGTMYLPPAGYFPPSGAGETYEMKLVIDTYGVYR